MKNTAQVSEQKIQELRLSLMTLVFVVFCAFLLVIATFTQLKVYTISDWHIKNLDYIPQIPMILFIAGFLGRKLSVLSILLYILTGLFLVPIFALGGGLDYILNMNFGYILAFLPAVFLSSNIVKYKISFLNLLLGTLIGVFIIHFIGMIYLVAILLIEHEPLQNILNWIANQTGNTILLDILLGFLAFILGNVIKIGLKKIT